MLINKTTIMSKYPNESYTERKSMHKPCGYSLDLVSSFDLKQNKPNTVFIKEETVTKTFVKI